MCEKLKRWLHLKANITMMFYLFIRGLWGVGGKRKMWEQQSGEKVLLMLGQKRQSQSKGQKHDQSNVF